MGLLDGMKKKCEKCGSTNGVKSYLRRNIAGASGKINLCPLCAAKEKLKVF